jgi:hypothetical protein
LQSKFQGLDPEHGNRRCEGEKEKHTSGNRKRREGKVSEQVDSLINAPSASAVILMGLFIEVIRD